MRRAKGTLKKRREKRIVASILCATIYFLIYPVVARETTQSRLGLSTDSLSLFAHFPIRETSSSILLTEKFPFPATLRDSTLQEPHNLSDLN